MGQEPTTRLSGEQVDEAVRALALAFQADPLFRYVLPDDGLRAERLPTFFAPNVRFGHLYGEVTATTGSVEGASVWTPPGVDVTPERAQEAGFAQIAEAFGPDGLQRFGEVMDHLQPVSMAEMPSDHFYLMAIGVVPARQRQGLGRALLQPMLTQADAAGLPSYLVTFEPTNVPFYESAGFRVLTHDVEPSSGLPFWTFGRQPRS